MKYIDSKISWVEILVASAVLAIIARYIWAKEFIEFENSLFEGVGLSSNVKYFITVPLVGYLYYRLYKKEEYKAKLKGQSVISKPMVAFVRLSFILILVLLFVAGNLTIQGS